MTELDLLKLAQKRDKTQGELEMLLYSGKAKHMTYKELWLSWYFGRPIEQLESVDFYKN